MAKRIVLCLDGTWNDEDGPHPTNVRLLFERVAAASRWSVSSQIQAYIPGVGTDRRQRPVPEWVEAARLKRRPPWLHRVVSNLAGGGAGYGMARRIKEAYAFMVQHYEPGDSIYLFGFSRGAFAVRSLAGFIDRVGLLLKDDIAYVEDAYRVYEQGGDLSRRLRRLGLPTRLDADHPAVLPIHMIGVWDTVERLGLPKALQWSQRARTGYHVTDFPRHVNHVRHALALHELRPLFEPLLWNEPARPGQTLKQVWFPGAHADVGGGYEDRRLSDAALAWMVREATEQGLSVQAASSVPSEACLAPVHHEVRGLFYLSQARVRRFLKASAELPLRDLLSHRWHESAVLRLATPEARPYPFVRMDVADALRAVDRCAVPLFMRLALELGLSPERMGAWSDRGEAPAPTGLTASAWLGVGPGDLQMAVQTVGALVQHPARMVDVPAAQLVTRSVTLLAALGVSEPLHDLSRALCALGDACLWEVDDPPIMRGLDRLREHAQALDLGGALWALDWATLARRIQAQVSCGVTMVSAWQRLSIEERRHRLAIKPSATPGKI